MLSIHFEWKQKIINNYYIYDATAHYPSAKSTTKFLERFMYGRGSISSFSSAGFIIISLKYLKPQVGAFTKGLLKQTASNQEFLHMYL